MCVCQCGDACECVCAHSAVILCARVHDCYTCMNIVHTQHSDVHCFFLPLSLSCSRMHEGYTCLYVNHACTTRICMHDTCMHTQHPYAYAALVYIHNTYMYDHRAYTTHIYAYTTLITPPLSSLTRLEPQRRAIFKIYKACERCVCVCVCVCGWVGVCVCVCDA